MNKCLYAINTYLSPSWDLVYLTLEGGVYWDCFITLGHTSRFVSWAEYWLGVLVTCLSRE